MYRSTYLSRTGKELVSLLNCKQFNSYLSRRPRKGSFPPKGLDAAAWDVEKVVAHTGNFKGSKANWRFRVRWLGYSAEDDTWETWENLRRTAALHQYLRDNNKASLIPKTIAVIPRNKLVQGESTATTMDPEDNR